MNSGLKILLVLLALGVAAFFVQRTLGAPGESPLGPVPMSGDRGDPAGDQEPVKPVVVERQPAAVSNGDDGRREVDDRPLAAEDAAQGVEGRLVDPFGQPIVDAEVFLFRGHGANLFEAMLRAQSGVLEPPAAATRSGDGGLFRVGINDLEPGKTYELRVTSPRFADHTVPNITLFPDKWHAAGVIQLRLGLVVEGRVLQQSSGVPIGGATVLLKPSNQTLVMTPTPGREDGLSIKTDAYGNYRFENATPGIVTVAAYAPEHARVERVNQNVRPDGENRFDFELPPGKSIAGAVTDGEGKPIHGARVQVLAISSKNPITVETRTDRDGRFEALGLVDGPYQAMVTAVGYVRADEKPIMAGEVDKHIVLETQGSVRVRVSAMNSRRINRFSIFVKKYIAQQDAYGNLMNMPEVRVGPRDLDAEGFYELGGLDPDTYALEVHSQGFAKNYSEPFTITVGGQRPELFVELSEGGAISGSLIGQDGRPVGNVLITTLPNEFEENALSEMFFPMIPFKVSQTGMKSRNDGGFKLEKLSPGTYQLKFAHPDHYTIFQKDILVEEGRTTELPPIRLMQGTLLAGSVTLDGSPGAQIKVQVSAAPDPNAEKPNMFSAVAVTDDQGQFVLPKRLPPGRYTASAGRQANPFQMVVDYQQTKQEFQVGTGQPQHQVHFRIQTQ